MRHIPQIVKAPLWHYLLPIGVGADSGERHVAVEIDLRPSFIRHRLDKPTLSARVPPS
jgi:hypothetical protein